MDREPRLYRPLRTRNSGRHLRRPTAADRRAAGVTSDLRPTRRGPRAHIATAPTTGTAAVAGENYYNELGTLPCCVSGYGTPSSPIGQAVPTTGSVIQLAAGSSYIEALHADGTVTAWGTSVNGGTGLGNNNGYALFAPGQVPLSGVIAIATGSSHTVYLTTGGVYTTGPGTETGSDLSGGYAKTPVRTNLPTVPTAIAAGGKDSYALMSDGTVWAWGDASGSTGDPEEGTGNQGNAHQPIQVVGLSGVAAISATQFTGFALRSDGTVWSWGQNYEGSAGQGSLTSAEQTTPRQVTGLTGVTKIQGGADAITAFAIRSDGTLWAWGGNDDGELGNGTTTSSGTPAQVPVPNGAVAVSASQHVVASFGDGTSWSWGLNRSGELGNGGYLSRTTPAPVFDMAGVAAIAASDSDTAFAADLSAPAPLPAYYFGADGSNPSGLADDCMQGQCSDDGGNTSTGAFSTGSDDISIPGRGVPLDFSRSYSSAQASTSGPLGYGWTFSYGLSLAVDSGSGVVTVTQEDGSQVKFTPSGSTYTAPPYVAASLVHNGDGTWTMTRKARTRFMFDSGGRLTAEIDLNGYATVLTYPSAGSEVVTDPSGRTLTLTLSGGQITRVTDSSSPVRSVTFGYDGSGNLSNVTDVGGGITHFTYDASHRLQTIRAPKYANDTTTSPSPVTTVQYDSSGRMSSQTDQVGNTTTYDYTSVAGATKITDGVGNVRLDRYENGRLVATTRGYGTSSAATWHYVYDASASEQLAACDPLGSCAITIYDAAGNLLTSSDGIGNQTINTYDALDDLLTTTDPKGVKTTYTYDTSGNVLTRARPLLDGTGATTATQTTTYGYGGTTPVYAGDITSVTDPNTKVTQYRYDAYGDMTSQTLPATPENSSGDRTTYGYNTGTGWLLSVVSPRGNLSGATAAQYTTTYTYDAFGDKTQVKDPLWSSSSPMAHQHTWHYDANGNLDYETDGSNHKTTYTYDPANELVKKAYDDGTFEQRSYFGDGSLKTYTNPRGKVTSYSYDPLGHQSTVTDPLNRVTTTVYDGPGNLIRKVNPGGSCDSSPYAGCETLTYDQADRLAGSSWADGQTTGTSNVAYDADGQRTAFTDASGTSAWSWDSLNRLTSVRDGNGKTISYGYDIANHQTSVTYPGGTNRITRDFDAAGRIDWIQDYRSNKTTFGYDADSNLTTTTEPTAAGVVDTTTYDPTEHSTNIKVAKGSTTLANFAYTRDGMDYVATNTTTGITEAAQTDAYNSREQLITSGATSTPTAYTYDADGNVTRRGSSSLAYDDADQLCWQSSAVQSSPTCSTVPSGATTFSYDQAGNRTSRVASGTTTTYGYDELNELRSYGSTGTYVYDANGLRESKTVSGTRTAFSWDHNGAAPDLLSDGTNNYIYGPDNQLLEQISSSGTVTYVHHDQLGSSRLLTSTAGANVGSYNYDAYGSVAAHTGTVATPLQYEGEYTDAESGFIYLRARYYEPSSAQFVNVDPAVDQTRDTYDYAHDDPVNDTDPTGLGDTDSVNLPIGVNGAVSGERGPVDAQRGPTGTIGPDSVKAAAGTVAAAGATVVMSKTRGQSGRKAPQLTGAEEAAIRAQADGHPADPKALRSAQRKLNTADKQGSTPTRNRQKRRGG